MKLFKNYNNIDEYNAYKISISKDNLTYLQNGVQYTASTPEGITSYNVICFIANSRSIYKNGINYSAADVTIPSSDLAALYSSIDNLTPIYVERTKGATNYTSADLNNLYSEAKIGKVVVDVTNSIRYEKYKEGDWFYFYYGG